VTELLDRTLIWNQRHLLLTLWEFEHFYYERRPTELPHPTAGYSGVALVLGAAVSATLDPIRSITCPDQISIRRYALPGAVPDSLSAPGAACELPE
jgi:hypothetical protein